MAGKGPKEGKWRPRLESPWCSQQHLLLPSIQGILRMAVRMEGAVQTKRTHRGHDWAQSPPAALGNLSSHPSKFCLQLCGQAQPSPAWPRQSLCFYLGVFPGTTQICLFSLASIHFLKHLQFRCLNEPDRPTCAGAKGCGNPAILRFEPR